MRPAHCFILFLLAGLLFPYAPGSEENDQGVVTAVYDGDTIRVSLNDGRSETVRLIGVDAPELDDARVATRFFALMSKRFAFISLYREKVTLSYDWERRDKYGRVLAYVASRHSLFNELIIQKGYAAALLKFPFRNDYRRRFQAAETRAREESRGMWRPEPYPIIEFDGMDGCLGELVRVRFVCAGVEKRGRFWFLRARGRDFSALLDEKDKKSFPGLENLSGRVLVVSGFLEEYRGSPQILLFLPLQLRIENRP